MKQNYDDDGHTVADMSGVGKPGLFPGVQRKETDTPKPSPWDDHIELEREEKMAAIFGMLKAALMIGGVYIAAFAVFIVILLALWGVL